MVNMEALHFDESLTALDVIKLPMTTDGLIVPEVMVAEIYQPRGLEVKEAGPDWLAGHCHWRGHTIPIISFEAMNQANCAAPKDVGYILSLIHI